MFDLLACILCVYISLLPVLVCTSFEAAYFLLEQIFIANFISHGLSCSLMKRQKSENLHIRTKIKTEQF